MSNSLIERSDSEIRDDVERELDDSSGLDSSLIGVAVHAGVVTLTGEVPNYWQRAAATNITLQTRGVTSVANEIVVRRDDATKTDSELAGMARDALDASRDVPSGAVLVEVHQRVVTLTGSVDTPDQRTAAHQAVQTVPAVIGVVNRIGVQTAPSSVHTQIMIKSALIQNAITDAENIEVHVEGSAVRLTGTVASEAERSAAIQAARRSALVTDVIDELVVRA